MKTLNKLEKHLGRFTIPYLYMVTIVCIIVGYVIRYAAPGVYEQLILIPSFIVLKHQYWRLFTWIFTVPYELSSGLSILFLPINLLFYYWLGRSLEMYWGRFIYNLYVIGGALFTNICVLIGSYYYYVWSPNATLHYMDIQDSVSAGLMITRLLLMSIFLAFTVVGGENTVYLYFVIPLKMKYLAYVDLAILLFYFATGGFFTRIIVFCSVANYFLYFFLMKSKYAPSISDIRRRQKFVKAKQMRRKRPNEYNPDGTIKFTRNTIDPGTGNPKGISIHKCAVCGRTELDSPDLEFRFCSKCNGNYEYCSEHLYTHQHIQ